MVRTEGRYSSRELLVHHIAPTATLYGAFTFRHVLVNWWRWEAHRLPRYCGPHVVYLNESPKLEAGVRFELTT